MENKKRRFIKEHIEKIKKQEKFKRLMLKKTIYADWLVDFINKKGSFSDDYLLYFPEEISEYDAKMVKILPLFYDVLVENAYKNGKHELIPTSLFYERAIGFSYKDEKFIIGCVVGQGSFFYCKKAETILPDKNNVNLDEMFNKNNQEEFLK